MQDKLATLRRLMDEGYELENIDSDATCVEARFQRGGLRTTLRLFPTDAERLLYPNARRMPRAWLRR